jgi:hypothetical protein
MPRSRALVPALRIPPGGNITQLGIRAPVISRRRRWLHPRAIVQRICVPAALLLLAWFMAFAPLTWIFAALGGALLVLGMAFEPALGLAALALTIPVADAVPLPLGPVTAVELLFGLVLIAWLARGIARHRIVVRRPPLSWSLLFMVWAFGLSLTQAVSFREGLPEWIKWAEFTMLYMVAGQLLTEPHVRTPGHTSPRAVR